MSLSKHDMFKLFIKSYVILSFTVRNKMQSILYLIGEKKLRDNLNVAGHHQTFIQLFIIVTSA